ncbi:MAG: hypothetical protein DI535_15750 [Citrobacter freundii]|nr:MAG: hypothetical protein DI535_15750 [Citrobacter freundii]
MGMGKSTEGKRTADDGPQTADVAGILSFLSCSKKSAYYLRKMRVSLPQKVTGAFTRKGYMLREGAMFLYDMIILFE